MPGFSHGDGEPTTPQQAIEQLNPGLRLPPGCEPARCRDCGASIAFLSLLDKWGSPSVNPRTGQQRMMPIDPGPIATGNVRCFNGTARVMTAGELVPADERYTTHMATCPKRQERNSKRFGGKR